MTDSPAAPRLSVIIPNWNGLALLRPCLDALRGQTHPSYEVIVVDNASTDGSVAALVREHPEVRVLALPTNTGYAGGCNAGIGAARGAILVVTNNDTEADPAWLTELDAALARHPECGSAASRLMIHRDRTRLHSAGDLVRRDGTADSRGVWQPYGPPYDAECEVFGPCGGAAAYRRELLEAVGLFDESFFMYMEDVDLSWRAQLAGWRCIYAPKSVVYHHLSATGGGALASYYVGRNTLWVIARNYPAALLRRDWPKIARAQARIAWGALRAIRGPAARARLRGQIAGLFTSLRWLGYRRRQMRRLRPSAAALAHIEQILE
ncbi:MAG: glycosyltransferase family 2 protein [Chloroflexota bacterium]